MQNAYGQSIQTKPNNELLHCRLENKLRLEILTSANLQYLYFVLEHFLYTLRDEFTALGSCISISSYLYRSLFLIFLLWFLSKLSQHRQSLSLCALYITSFSNSIKNSFYIFCIYSVTSP